MSKESDCKIIFRWTPENEGTAGGFIPLFFQKGGTDGGSAFSS